MMISYKDKFKQGNREEQSTESIRRQIEMINEHCVRSSACIMRVKHQRPTGKSMDKLMRISTAVLKGM